MVRLPPPLFCVLGIVWRAGLISPFAAEEDEDQRVRVVSMSFVGGRSGT